MGVIKFFACSIQKLVNDWWWWKIILYKIINITNKSNTLIVSSRKALCYRLFELASTTVTNTKHFLAHTIILGINFLFFIILL